MQKKLKRKLIKPSQVFGIVNSVPSKSFMQRAIALSLLSEGKSRIYNPTFCDDAVSALRVAEGLGAEINSMEEIVEIEGVGNRREAKKKVLDCGESGLCARMFAPITALYDEEIRIEGRGSLLKRPMEMLKDLEKFGARCKLNNNHLPAVIKGPLKGNVVEIDASITSQFLSGLLIALPLAENNSALIIKKIASKPYVDITLELMDKFGVKVEFEENRIEIEGNQHYNATEYEVEGDWSSASYLLVGAALTGEITIKNLKNDSLQADAGIMDALVMAGSELTIGERSIKVRKEKLEGFEFDATDSPDLIPSLVALASGCEGKSIIKGVNRLEYKESNRAKALLEEFSKIGARIKRKGDEFIVEGGRLKGGKVSSHSDHRIAMSLAIAGLISEKGVLIEGSECVKKSYPQFFEHLEMLGVEYE